MKNLTATICLTVVVLLGSAGTSWSADVQKGLTAAQSGDFATALSEWIPLAKQGNADAQYNLGVMYENGHGVPRDDKIAVELYRFAAEQGHAKAQHNLGQMYENGQGATQDCPTYRHVVYRKIFSYFSHRISTRMIGLRHRLIPGFMLPIVFVQGLCLRPFLRLRNFSELVVAFRISKPLDESVVT